MMIELETGAVVASHYVIVSLLGVGGMGAVYRARDTRTDTLWAMKVLRHARGDLAMRFIREARIASALAHPNIARVHEVLELDDGSPAIVMELLVGESLGVHLARLGGKIGAASIARTCIGVVAAIKTAHDRGVVHRDLKPDNIFLCDDGTVKVLDFGIAKVTLESPDPAITAAALTETGQILGTPQYMAPEQIFGEKDIDGRADIWALGVILYQALAGVRPFHGANPGQIFKAIALNPPIPLTDRAPHTPQELADLVASMLVHARAERLADLDHVTRVLERIASKQDQQEQDDEDGLGEATTLLASSPPALVDADRVESPGARRRPWSRNALIASAAVVAIGTTAVLSLRSPTLVSPVNASSSSSPPAQSASASASAVLPAPPAEVEVATTPTTTTPTTSSSLSSSSSPPPAPPPAKITATIATGGSTAPLSSTSATTAVDAGARPNRSGPLKRDEF